MKKKHLEMVLSNMEDLKAPDPKLEQYPTPSHIVVDILFRALANGDITDRRVAELGCGGAPFAIGSWALGAGKVYGFDIDPKCIDLSNANLEKARSDEKVGSPPGEVYFRRTDISGEDPDLPRVDTVFMNPPFGSQNRNADRPFIHRAMEIGEKVYSIHNRVTRSFLLKEIGRRGRVLDEVHYTMRLDHRYHFHTRENVDIEIIMLVYSGDDMDE